MLLYLWSLFWSYPKINAFRGLLNVSKYTIKNVPKITHVPISFQRVPQSCRIFSFKQYAIFGTCEKFIFPLAIML